MIRIRPLTEFNPTRFRELSAGYISSAKYEVSKRESDTETIISLTLQRLEAPYKKNWEYDSNMEKHYNKVIEHGLSLGVYNGERLVGLAIAEKQAWNRTLWVWEFHIEPEYRQKGIGKQLMDRLAKIGKSADCRVMVCETQNTNVPAIRFYRKVGYEVGAIDLSYYTNSDLTDFEVAVFMKRMIE